MTLDAPFGGSERYDMRATIIVLVALGVVIALVLIMSVPIGIK